MKKLFFFLLMMAALISGCVYLIPFNSPKPEKFNLYQQNKAGIKYTSHIKTNGVYYFVYKDKAFLSYEDYKKNILHENFAGYYRFKKNGEIRINDGIPQSQPDSIYYYKKKSIEMDMDKALYGYYLASGDSVKIEYVKELRENMRNEFYDSVGILSKNGDTLYVKEHKKLKDGKIEILNRTCLFHSFPE